MTPDPDLTLQGERLTLRLPVGFEPVGVIRDYERTDGGPWHDGLVMDLLAHELAT
jgi:hypothetical protein